MMRILAFCLVVLSLLWTATPAQAGNPFAAAGASHAQQDSDAGGQGLVPWGAFISRVSAAQREVRTQLSARVRALMAAPSAWGFAVFLGLAFAYGAMHAAGPGHGKAVASSFVLARGEPVRRAALLGFVMGAAHATSAVVLVLFLHLVLERSFMLGFHQSGLWVERVSYVLVAGIALWLIREAIKGEPEQDLPGAGSRRGFWATGLATGLVPCPGAAIVLLFSLALGATWIGLAAVGAMALGMGVTIALAASVAAFCGRSALVLSSSRPLLVRRLRQGAALCGGVLIFVVSAVLFYGTWG